MTDLFYPVLTLNLLLVVGAWCIAKPSRPAAVGLAALAITWLFSNGPLEGHVLWTISPQHGLTVSDLLSVAAAVVAVRTWHSAPATE